MRLQLALALLAIGCAARHRVVTSADVRSATYIDNDHTVVLTNTVAVRAKPHRNVTLGGRYLVDFTSSASVDVTSAATPRFTEFRHEGAGSLAFADGTNGLDGSYVYSEENDWSSHTVALSGSRDLLDHNLTLSLGADAQINHVGRAGDEAFRERLWVAGGFLSAGIVASPMDVLTLNYTLSIADGYQSSAYRYAFFDDPSVPGHVLAGPEVVPQRRTRHAFVVRWNHAFADFLALRSHARAYVDDWALWSGTGGTELALAWHALDSGLSIRLYGQHHARLYEDVYPERRTYMTADRELSSFVDVFGTLRIGLRTPAGAIVDEVRASLSLTGFTFRFFDFDRLPHREGVVLEAAAGVSF